MKISPEGIREPIRADEGPSRPVSARFLLQSTAGRNNPSIIMLEAADEPAPRAGDPGTVILICANCGAEMIERKCKLICRCGYFLSCSDYY